MARTCRIGGRTLVLRMGTQSWMASEGRVFRIGRHPANDLVLSDPKVSRFHAQISWEGRGPVLHDCGSANGTFVDGLEIDGPLPLESEQILGVGPWTLTLELHQPPALLEDDGGRFTFFADREGDELLGAFRGAPELHRIMLILEDEQRTGTLELTLPECDATITYCLGTVVAANYRHLHGVYALERLLRAGRGRYHYTTAFELSDNTLDISVRSHLRDGYWATRRHLRAA